MEQFINLTLPNIETSKVENYLAALRDKEVENPEDLLELTPNELHPIPLLHAKRLIKAVSSPQQANNSNKVVRSNDLLLNYKIPSERLPLNLSVKLENGQKLNSDERREFVRFLCNDIAVVDSKPSLTFVTRIASDIRNKYPATFTDRDVHGNIIGTGFGNLRESMYTRFQNESRKSVTPKKKRAYDSSNSPAIEAFNEEEQEELRKKLKIEHTLHVHAQDKEGCNLVKDMMDSFHLRRHHTKNLTNKEVMEQWPCLLSSKVMLDQDFALMQRPSITIPDHIPKAICDLIRSKPKMMRQAETTLADIEKAVHQQKSLAPYENGVFPAVINVLGDKMEGLFRVYEVSVSIVQKIKMNGTTYLRVLFGKFHETYSKSFSFLLQASKTIRDVMADPSIPPTPIIAVLGEFSLKCNTVL